MKKNVLEKYVTVGLFGTCGNSTFRKEIMIPAFEKAGVSYFNPQVEDWTPECAKEEAKHLANDAIICFPVTGETYGTGSLAETGFSVVSAINNSKSSKIILMIDEDVDEGLKAADPVAAKESLRARALVLAHIQELNLANVYIVSTIEQMTELAIILYGAAQAEYKAAQLEKVYAPVEA